MASAGSSNDRLQSVAAVVPGALFTYQRRPDGSGRYLYLSACDHRFYHPTAEEPRRPRCASGVAVADPPEDVPHLGARPGGKLSWSRSTGTVSSASAIPPRRDSVESRDRGQHRRHAVVGMLSDITPRRRPRG